MRTGSWLVPVFALLLPIVACGVPDSDPVLAIKPQGPTARFTAGAEGSATPTFLDVPFPSDAYMANGKFGPMPGIERTFKRNGPFLSDQLKTLNGWSRIAGVMFAIDDPRKPANPDTGEPATAVIDRTTLPATEDDCKADGSSVFLIDMDAGTRIACRAVFHDEESVENGRSLLIVGPPRGVVLEEGHHYCAVITSRLKDADGVNVAPSDELVAATERKEGPLASVYGPAFDKVKSVLGGALGADKIVALSPYTTQKSMDDTYAARDLVEAAPVPTLKWDQGAITPMTAAKFAKPVAPATTAPAGFTATLDAWLGVVANDKKLPDGTDDPDENLPVRAHDKIAAVGTAVFDAINFLQVKDKKYDEVGHATFAHDAAGKPIPAPEKPTSKIWITISIPDAPMPPEGYPAVIVQHGLSGSRAYLMTMANTFAKKGWVAVAIDSTTFGARANDPKYLVDATSDYASSPGATYSAGDGISDLVQVNSTTKERAGSFDFFGGLKNLIALRDQLRQASIDTAQVVKILRANPDLTPLQTGATAPKIDGSKIAYVGDSLGGIEGALAAAIEPNVKAWTLNVAGGGVLIELAGHGPVVNANLSLAGSLNFGFLGGSYDEGHPVVVIGQALMDAGDPISFADRIVKSPMPLAGQPTQPRNIFQIEVLYDELVANESNEALARAGGWSMASPNVGLNAGASDTSGAAFRSGGIVLPFLPPSPTGYKDTPTAGVTALVAQVSPAHHGADLVRSTGDRTYRIPFNATTGKLVVDRQNASFAVPCPYRELQATMVGFFESAFAGGGAPVIAGLPEPKRDLDGDGSPDTSDTDPVDKNKK